MDRIKIVKHLWVTVGNEACIYLMYSDMTYEVFNINTNGHTKLQDELVRGVSKDHLYSIYNRYSKMPEGVTYISCQQFFKLREIKNLSKKEVHEYLSRKEKEWIEITESQIIEVKVPYKKES